jgi:hypothetical protein
MTGTEKGAIADLALLRQVLDWAFTLHQRLPEAPAASGRAITPINRLTSDFSMSAFQRFSV